MNSEARHEFDVKYEGRVQKIREAAAAAIKQLDQLRSGTNAPQAFDAQVAPLHNRTYTVTGAILLFTERLMGQRDF